MIRCSVMEQAAFYATLRLLSNHDGIPKCPFYKAEHGQNGGQTVMLRRYYNTSCHGLQTQPHFRLIGRQLGPDHSGPCANVCSMIHSWCKDHAPGPLDILSHCRTVVSSHRRLEAMRSWIAATIAKSTFVDSGVAAERLCDGCRDLGRRAPRRQNSLSSCLLSQSGVPQAAQAVLLSQ